MHKKIINLSLLQKIVISIIIGIFSLWIIISARGMGEIIGKPIAEKIVDTINSNNANSLKFLSELSLNMNKTLPKKIGAGLLLTNTSAKENNLIYNYKLINLSSNDINNIDSDILTDTTIDKLIKYKIFRPTVKEGLLSLVCKDKNDKSDIIYYGVKTTYSYYTNDNRHLIDVTLSKDDCR